MSANTLSRLLSVKAIILLSGTLLIVLWLMMIAYTWINIQILESNHQIEDKLHDATLTTHIILKTLDEALLTNGTIPSLKRINKESKQLDTTLNNIKNTHSDNIFIVSSLNEILKEKIKLDKKFILFNNESNEISINNPDIMVVAGSISATIESILNKTNKLKKYVSNKVVLANKDIKASIISAIFITVIISLLIFLFLYKGVTKPFSILLQETEKLETEKAIAEKANQAKSEFLSRMSHELRTPLHAIIGFGQILGIKKDELNENQQNNVNEILKAGHHLLNLINQVLDLDKIESGKMELSMVEVDIDDLVKDCIPLITMQSKTHQLELIDNVSNKGYTVLGDFIRLKQVLLNILSNAIKYNNDHARIIIDSEIINTQRLRITVADSGEGLTDEQIANLFTPFERLDTLTNTDGVGIGLVISKYLVELMKGNIGVNSTPHAGSTFWLELELAQPQDKNSN